jgi:hypothetical protein
MQTIFGLIFQAFIVLGILGLGYMLFEGVVMTSHRLEKMIRTMSVATGVFVYGAAKATGVSLTVWVTKAVESGTWFTFLTVGTLFPSILGILVAKFVIRALKSADYMAMRVMLFMGSLILLQFCDLYIETGLKAGLDVTRHLAPNLLFLSFFGLYLIFKFKPQGFNKKQLDPVE